MNIEAINTNSNVNTVNKVSSVKIKPIEEPQKTVNKDTFVKSTEKDLPPKTYNSSGKVDDKFTAMEQSMAMQANTNVANTKVVEPPKKTESSAPKVQSVSKSVDVRA